MLNTPQKEIEEMAVICCESDNNCTDCFKLNERLLGIRIKNKAEHCQAYCYAERLYEQGYRKIDKDSVVLSREEYKLFTDIEALRLQVQDSLNKLKFGLFGKL